MAWGVCGTGCWATPLSDGHATGVRPSTTARWLDNGEFVARVVTESPGRRLVRVVALDSGTIMAAVVQTTALGTCVPLGQAAGAPLVVPYFEASRGVFLGRAKAGHRMLTWSESWVRTPPGVPTSVFDTSHGFGLTLDDGSVAVLEDGGPAFGLLERDATSHRSDAHDDLVIWTRPGGAHGDVIRARLRSAAPVTIPDGKTNGVAAADRGDAHIASVTRDAIVWIETRGPKAATGEYDAARLYTLPRAALEAGAAPIAGAKLRAGPVLEARSGLLDLAAYGDHAATIGCAGPAADRCELFVASFATGKVARWPAPAGSVLRGVFAISDRNVLVGVSDRGTPAQRLDRLMLLDLPTLMRADRDAGR